jgi:hypothetical protein
VVIEDKLEVVTPASALAAHVIRLGLGSLGSCGLDGSWLSVVVEHGAWSRAAMGFSYSARLSTEAR